MNANTYIRLLATLAILLFAGELAYAMYVIPDDDIVVDLLSLTGYGSYLPPSTWLTVAYYGLHVAALLSLIVFLDKARWFYIAVLVTFLLIGLGLGMGIGRPVSVFLSTILSWVQGGIFILLLLPLCGNNKVVRQGGTSS